MTSLDPHAPPPVNGPSRGLWTPERATAAPIVVTCAACGEPLTVPAALSADLVPGSRLVHDVCPRDYRPIHHYEVRLEVVDTTAAVGLQLYAALRAVFGVCTEDDVPAPDLLEQLTESIAGFRVQTTATTLREAVGSLASPLASKWQTLYEKANLADASE